MLVEFVWGLSGVLRWESSRKVISLNLAEHLAVWMRGVYLTSHWIRVDLAHVCPAVIYLDIGDVQFPSVMSVVCHREPWVVGHHVCLYGEDSFRVGFDPRHLQNRECMSFAVYSKIRAETRALRAWKWMERACYFREKQGGTKYVCHCKGKTGKYTG